MKNDPLLTDRTEFFLPPRPTDMVDLQDWILLCVGRSAMLAASVAALAPTDQLSKDLASAIGSLTDMLLLCTLGVGSTKIPKRMGMEKQVGETVARLRSVMPDEIKYLENEIMERVREPNESEVDKKWNL